MGWHNDTLNSNHSANNRFEAVYTILTTGIFYQWFTDKIKHDYYDSVTQWMPVDNVNHT